MTDDLGPSGYAVRTQVAVEQVDALLTLFAGLDVDPERPFYASSNDAPPATAEAVHAAIVDILAPTLRDAAPDHTCFLAGFVAKGGRAGSRIAYHQDLTYTDERTARTRIFWIPLVDTRAPGSGGLRVVPGSHRWTSGPRPAQDVLPTEALQDDLEARSCPVDAGPGAVVEYDPGLVHGSHGNTKPHPRPAVAVALAPRDAPLVHCRSSDGVTSAHAVDGRFYRTQSLWSRPVGHPEVALWGDPVTEEDLRRGLGDAAGGATGDDRAGVRGAQRLLGAARRVTSRLTGSSSGSSSTSGP